jgi:Polyketide cyclase / dehydrase and lipid transport
MLTVLIQHRTEGSSLRYTLICEKTINAAPQEAWAVWSDIGAYPAWDDREEAADVDGPLAPGVQVRYRQRGGRSGTYVITAVDPPRSWTTEEKVPRGFLVTQHDIAAIGDGRTLVRRSYRVDGLTSIPFRLVVAPGMRREMEGTFAALEREVARRRSSAGNQSTEPLV